MFSKGNLVYWGDSGEQSTIVKAGDFLHVPAWLPHQEINPSDTQPFRWVIVRSTSEPIVVNLPADFWIKHRKNNTLKTEAAF